MCPCRYNVYASLEAEAAYLKLNANGIYLTELQDAFADLQVDSTGCHTVLTRIC